MKIKTLEDLLTDELKDLYSAENQVMKALPKMAKTTQSRELRTAFEEHVRQTESQVRRIERVCEELGVSPNVRRCGNCGRPGGGLGGSLPAGQGPPLISAQLTWMRHTCW